MIPSFWKIRIYLLIIGFLVVFFIIGAARSAFALMPELSIGDVVTISDTQYLITAKTTATACSSVTSRTSYLSSYLLMCNVSLHVSSNYYGDCSKIGTPVSSTRSGYCNANNTYENLDWFIYGFEEYTPDQDDVDQDGYSTADGDCNDNDATIHPGATDTCGDGIDQDCDGSDTTCPTTETDNDGDGWSVEDGDLNDSDATIYPGAYEICGDGIDQDCDGEDLSCDDDDTIDPVAPENLNPDIGGSLSPDCSDLDASWQNFSYSARLDCFMEKVQSTNFFSLIGNPADDIPLYGSPQMQVDLGSYGTYDYDFEAVFGTSITVLRSILLIISGWVSLRLLILKK